MKTIAFLLMLAAAPKVGRPVPLKFKALDGKIVDLTAMRGRVVLLTFWATWCAPCKEELPHLKTMYEQQRSRGLEILGISLDNRRESLTYFLDKESVPWPQHFDGKGIDNDVARRFGVDEIPTLWLVDRKGRLRDTDGGTDLDAKVKRLLAE